MDILSLYSNDIMQERTIIVIGMEKGYFILCLSALPHHPVNSLFHPFESALKRGFEFILLGEYLFKRKEIIAIYSNSYNNKMNYFSIFSSFHIEIDARVSSSCFVVQTMAQRKYEFEEKASLILYKERLTKLLSLQL
jgi:hypothetical protein